MKNIFNILFNEDNRKTTVILFSVSIVFIFFALIIGIDDNPPGILLIYLGSFALILTFIHHWRESKKFLILFVLSIFGAIIFGILHNLFDGLQIMTGEIIVLSQILVFLSVTSFLIALIVCPSGMLIGAFGSIAFYFKNRKSRRNNENERLK